ncbi:MAG: hypothetical protein AAGJ46_12860 [Planctomycetota bacterium]
MIFHLWSNMKKQLLAFAAIVATALPASATVAIPGAPADPVPDTFGAIPAATFGGSGIPNTAMAISTSVDGANTITLGIAATPRFSGTTVTNDGMGSYTVGAGEGDPGLSLWNFSFYTNIAGGGSLANYQFDLRYDLDAAAGNSLGTLGSIDLNASVFGAAELASPGSGPAALAGTDTVESSQNLGFTFLTTGVPGSVVAPTPTVTFDPNDFGAYSFQIAVSDVASGTLIDTVSIAVSAVPEPTAATFGALLTTGLVTVAVRRKRSKLAA